MTYRVKVAGNCVSSIASGIRSVEIADQILLEAVKTGLTDLCVEEEVLEPAAPKRDEFLIKQNAELGRMLQKMAEEYRLELLKQRKPWAPWFGEVWCFLGRLPLFQ